MGWQHNVSKTWSLFLVSGNRDTCKETIVNIKTRLMNKKTAYNSFKMAYWESIWCFPYRKNKNPIIHLSSNDLRAFVQSHIHSSIRFDWTSRLLLKWEVEPLQVSSHGLVCSNLFDIELNFGQSPSKECKLRDRPVLWRTQDGLISV